MIKDPDTVVISRFVKTNPSEQINTYRYSLHQGNNSQIRDHERFPDDQINPVSHTQSEGGKAHMVLSVIPMFLAIQAIITGIHVMIRICTGLEK